jgi:hypothetical protein
MQYAAAAAAFSLAIAAGQPALALTRGACAWSADLGGPGFSAKAPRIAVDRRGNTIVGATFEGTAHVGGGSFTSEGGGDVLIVKLDPRGRLLWARRFGDASLQELGALAVDGEGDVVLAGVTAGTVDFGAGPLAGDRLDLFVAKLAPDGRAIWARRFGGAEAEDASAIAAAKDGGVILGGSLEGRVDFGGPVVDNHGAFPFLLRLDAAGRARWARSFGGSTDQTVVGVALDPDDAVVVAEEAKRVVIDGRQFKGPGTSNAFVASLDRDGRLGWAKMLGQRGDSAITSLAVAPSGDRLIAGWFDGAIDLGAGSLAGTGRFVGRLDASGRALWGHGTDALAPSIALSPAGEVLVAGAGVGSLVVERHGAGGDRVWQRRFRAPVLPGAAVAADPSGRMVVAGRFEGALSLGCGRLHASGRDVFVATLAP